MTVWCGIKRGEHYHSSARGEEIEFFFYFWLKVRLTYYLMVPVVQKSGEGIAQPGSLLRETQGQSLGLQFSLAIWVPF